MLREQVVSLVKNSIREVLKLDDYSSVYYKVRVADKFMEGGVFSSSHQPNYDYLMSYPDSMEFFRIYNEALETDERFNNIEIHFDRDMNHDAVFTWDQAAYDADVQGNKKLKKGKA
jgi:hypothetical protein